MIRLLRRASVGFSGFRSAHLLGHGEQGISTPAVDVRHLSWRRRSVDAIISRLGRRMTRRYPSLEADADHQVVHDNPPNNSRSPSIDDFIIRTSSRLSWQPPSARVDSNQHDASIFWPSRQSRLIRSRRLLRNRSTTSLFYPRPSAYEVWAVDVGTRIQNRRTSQSSQQSIARSSSLLQRLRRRLSTQLRSSDSMHETQQRAEPASSLRPHEIATGSLRRMVSRLQRRSTSQGALNHGSAEESQAALPSDVQRQVSRRQQNRLRRQEAKQARQRERQYKRRQRAGLRRQQVACDSTDYLVPQLNEEAQTNVDGAPAAEIDVEPTASEQLGMIKDSTTRGFPEANAGLWAVMHRHHRRSSSSVSFDSPIYNDSFV